MAAGAMIPIHGLVRMEFTLQPQQTRRMGSSGNSVIGVTGPSVWRLSVNTVRLRLEEARVWSAWLNDRKERGETFLAWNLYRILPYGPLGAPDGPTVGVVVDAANSQLQLTNVGAYVATEGDFISYRTAGNGYYAGEVAAPALASGGNITVKVNPRPLPANPTPSVRRVQALAEFELTTDPGPFEDYVTRSLAFEAMQVLR